MDKKIPKRIFYVWGANEPKRIDVELCIKTWQYAMPDYNIIEINENSFEYFHFQEELKNNEWFRTVYQKKMYAYVADYIRIKVLYDNGGIYLDTDVTTIKSFNNFLNEPAFVGIQESSVDGNLDAVEPAILGSGQNNELLGEILKFYNKSSLHNIWNTDIYTMPQIFKFVLENNYEKQVYPAKNKQHIIRYKNISIFPEEYFIPFRFSEKFIPKCITSNTYSIHWFNASWVRPEVLYFLKNKHQIALKKINASYAKYKTTNILLKLLQHIFSIKNEYSNGVKRKIITILGLKIKILKQRHNLKNYLKENNYQILNIYEKDTKNIGDLSCAPYLYFQELQKNAISVGVKSFSFIPDITDKIIIVGGGGLFLPYFESEIRNILKLSKNNKVIIWGCGFDNYIGDEVSKIDLSQAALVGIRDFNQSDYRYVPCASCMSPLFDTYRNNKVIYKYVFYLHNDYSKGIMDIISDVPVAFNKDLQSLEDSLKFLSSAECIFTNSFHGLYWATLLGKKVAVLPWYHNSESGFSNKFQSFKYTPLYVKDIRNFEKHVSSMKSYPNALQECRSLNKAFYDEVIKLKTEIFPDVKSNLPNSL